MNRFLTLIYSGPKTFGNFCIGLHTKIASIIYNNLLADALQFMTEGTEGQVLTKAMMETNAIITFTPTPSISQQWAIPLANNGNTVNSGLYVSKYITYSLPAPVEIDGVEYLSISGNCWRWPNRYHRQFIEITFMNEWSSNQWYEKLTTFGLIVIGHDGDAYNFHDVMVYNGTYEDSTPEYSAVQVRGAPGELSMLVHTYGPDGNYVPITIGKIYYFNHHFNGNVDGVTGITHFSLYDPNNGYKHVGTSTTVIQLGRKVMSSYYGHTDGHGDTLSNSEDNYSYIKDLGWDRTGQYPILPVSI